MTIKISRKYKPEAASTRSLEIDKHVMSSECPSKYLKNKLFQKIYNIISEYWRNFLKEKNLEKISIYEKSNIEEEKLKFDSKYDYNANDNNNDKIMARC